MHLRGLISGVFSNTGLSKWAVVYLLSEPGWHKKMEKTLGTAGIMFVYVRQRFSLMFIQYRPAH